METSPWVVGQESPKDPLKQYMFITLALSYILEFESKTSLLKIPYVFGHMTWDNWLWTDLEISYLRNDSQYLKMLSKGGEPSIIFQICEA